MERHKQKILNYLNALAEQDSAFAEKMKNENKDIDKCMQFVISEVAKLSNKKNCCFDDDVVYGFAVHYYDEENVTIDNVNAKIVYAGPITDDDMAVLNEQARKDALDQLTKEQLAKMKGSTKKQEQRKEEVQLSLF